MEVSGVKTEKEMVKHLGYCIGYGRMMQLAQECWEEHLVASGSPSGGAFAYGPCLVMTVKCPCSNPVECDYCCGAGWVTKGVKKLIEQSKGENR